MRTREANYLFTQRENQDIKLHLLTLLIPSLSHCVSIVYNNVLPIKIFVWPKHFLQQYQLTGELRVVGLLIRLVHIQCGGHEDMRLPKSYTDIIKGLVSLSFQRDRM